MIITQATPTHQIGVLQVAAHTLDDKAGIEGSFDERALIFAYADNAYAAFTCG